MDTNAPKLIIVSEADEARRRFVKKHFPGVMVIAPDECLERVAESTGYYGADRVIEVAGSEDSFEMAWRVARPNAIVTIVALYNKSQILPLPDMYGKNLTFKTGGVDACDCESYCRRPDRYNHAHYSPLSAQRNTGRLRPV